MPASPARIAARLAPAGIPVVRDLVRVGLGRVFGPPPAGSRLLEGDAGLLGPGSASWAVIAEPAAIVGGIRALLVQLLHPLAMAGVAEHSAFREDPLGRLRRTAWYVTATTYGPMAEVLAVARAVRRVHGGVEGTGPDGSPYQASDPRLLSWVGMALTASFLATDAAYAPRPASAAAADAFVAEQSRGAALLDPRIDLDALARAPGALAALRDGTLPLPMLDEGTLPRSVTELHARMATFDTELEVTPQARQALRFLRWPSVPPAVRAGYLPLLGGAVATLAPRHRRLLGLPGSRTLAAPVVANTRLLPAGMRLATGTSPAAGAARARARAEG